MQSPGHQQFMLCDMMLTLHDSRHSYTSWELFQPELSGLLQQGRMLSDCLQLIRALGILEPFTGEYIPPETIQIQGVNYRESLIANGLLSRNRGMLMVLEQIYGSIEILAEKRIYLGEALSGFAVWLRRHLGGEKLVCSEYLEGALSSSSSISHQDLCALTFPDASFDIVLCNELFEHIYDLNKALREIARVLRPSGLLLSTFPMAFGQKESIIKAHHNHETGETELLLDAEFHSDYLRPDTGSLVYRIPGWELIDQLKVAGFKQASIHYVASWKHGVLGADIPGILVLLGTL
jgi:SAM-dependent methyltransferase